MYLRHVNSFQMRLLRIFPEAWTDEIQPDVNFRGDHHCAGFLSVKREDLNQTLFVSSIPSLFRTSYFLSRNLLDFVSRLRKGLAGWSRSYRHLCMGKTEREVWEHEESVSGWPACVGRRRRLIFNCHLTWFRPGKRSLVAVSPPRRSRHRDGPATATAARARSLNWRSTNALQVALLSLETRSTEKRRCAASNAGNAAEHLRNPRRQTLLRTRRCSWPQARSTIATFCHWQQRLISGTVESRSNDPRLRDSW